MPTFTEEQRADKLGTSTHLAIRRAQKMIEFMRLVYANEALTLSAENTHGMPGGSSAWPAIQNQNADGSD
jgi:hypothetical protein